MSNKSNNYGRAYEFVYLLTLYEEVLKFRPVSIEKNTSYYASEKAWNTLTDSEKNIYKISALAGVNLLFDLEPLILDDSEGIIELKIQADNKGIEGDVRDILITKESIKWEIGLSLKHNHFAVKHSRLSKTLDFGKNWYGIECSSKYWQDVKPIFEFLTSEQKNNKKWRDLTEKEDKIYIPLLNAFKDEILMQNKLCKRLPKLLVQYLVGMFDFYKIISLDVKRITRVQAINLNGTLNRQGRNRKSSIKLKTTMLPSKIIAFDYKENSKNTLELYFDRGWQFSFRIHNASTNIEPSLKFDIQIIGMPTTIISIDCVWKNN